MTFSGLVPAGPHPSHLGSPIAGCRTSSGVSGEQSRWFRIPPFPTDPSSCGVAQDTVGSLGCEDTLPGHVEPLVNLLLLI